VSSQLETAEEPGQGNLKDRIIEFAQRKPGALLAAAAAVGFVTGRVLKRSSGDDGGEDGGGQALLVIPAEEWSA
jgi:hypothetical protein